MNLSPNLTPSNVRDERYGEMYEQIIYNTIKTVGLSKLDLKPRLDSKLTPKIKL